MIQIYSPKSRCAIDSYIVYYNSFISDKLIILCVEGDTFKNVFINSCINGTKYFAFSTVNNVLYLCTRFVVQCFCRIAGKLD